MNRRWHNSGFTLMELLLVMVVIAVAAAIAAPGFTGFSRGRRLPNTAIALMTTARWCRVQAIINGTTYRLNLDHSNRQWSVTKDDGTGVFVEMDEKEKQGQAYTLPEGIDFGQPIFESTETEEEEASEEYVTFKPNGRADVVTIRLVATENGHYVDIANDMPLGTFHILSSAGSP
jgi:type II secretion system protein H